MIMNKKTTSRFTSVISAVIAVVMLSTTVFASGIIQNSVALNDIKYEVYNGDNKIALKNEPFIYSSEYYLPLRDILNGFNVTDIAYTAGEIRIKFPNDMTKNDTEEIMLKIGGALIKYNNKYGVVMRCAPVLHNNVTYVTVDYFEDMMRNFDMQGFRLNVIRPTEPENYYTKDEKVFIGTAEEQDNYSGERVKRIIVDENGETIAVVPVENQISEKIQRKKEETGIWNTYNSFYHMLYGSATSIYDFAENAIFTSELYVIEKNDNDIAYIGIADIIRIPQNALNVGNRMIITNTYDGYGKNKDMVNTSTDRYSARLLSNPNNSANGFLDMWELGEYEAMKNYCSDDFIKNNFRFTDDAETSLLANVCDIQTIDYTMLGISENYENQASVKIPVQANITRPPHSSLSSGNISFNIILNKQNNGNWLVCGIDIN